MADWYFRGGNGGLRPCPGCRNLVKTSEEFCPYCARRLRPENGPLAWLRRELRQPFAVTRILLGLLGAVFVLQLAAELFLPSQYKGAGGGNAIFNLLTASPVTYIRMGSNFNLFVYAFGQYWRFLTACFLHFGLLHILFNGWAFWDLGRLAERMWGGKQVFATFILTGVAGFWVSYLVHIYALGPVNSAGASGAICGLLGLMLGAYYKARWHIGEALGSALIRWAVMILAFGLVAGADNAAHIGGMISGAVLGYFLPPTANGRNSARHEKIWSILAAAAMVVMLAGFAFAIVFFARGPEYVEALFRMLR